MPASDELLAELGEVVDLAVEGEVDGSVLVRHRLLAVGREIDDGESAVGETDAAGVIINELLGSGQSFPSRSAAEDLAKSL